VIPIFLERNISKTAGDSNNRFYETVCVSVRQYGRLS